jgi:hypothetical protein
MGILGVFICVMVVETVGFHFLIGPWQKKAAWIFTALSAYAILQLYAHAKAIKARPVIIRNGSLEVRNGLAFLRYVHAITDKYR